MNNCDSVCFMRNINVVKSDASLKDFCQLTFDKFSVCYKNRDNPSITVPILKKSTRNFQTHVQLK